MSDDSEAKDLTPEDVDAIADPGERARLATQLLSTYQRRVAKIAHTRRRAIAELRSSGLSYAQVADVLGLSRGRIAQLDTTPYAVEQEFFGGHDVTIATPLRTAGIERPVIAQEDFEAAMKLSRFLNAARVNTTFAQIAPDGAVDLSPPALVLICGPKSSPVVRELIGTDPILRFAPDEGERWHITDRGSGESFWSPLDVGQPRNEDVAYLARLRLPGQQRTALVIAGIHAVGSLGVASYLSEPDNLHRLHSQVGARPFSAVVRSTFTREPLAVVSARIAMAPRVHV